MEEKAPLTERDEDEFREERVRAVLADVHRILRDNIGKSPLILPWTRADVPKLDVDTEIGIRGALDMLKRQQIDQ